MYRAGNRTDDDDDDDDDDLSSNMTKRVENKKEESKLLAIKYSRVQGLEILDQLKLPFEHSFMAIKTCEDGYSAIKAMNVRGAPAIAITAALAIAIELETKYDYSVHGDLYAFVNSRAEYVVNARPTAVNLGNMVKELRTKTSEVEMKCGKDDVERAKEMIMQWLENMLEKDIEHNKAIGRIGADAVVKACARKGKAKLTVLTCCNTGSLATAGYGTALGVVRNLHETGRLEHCYCVETRPYNQGSRLTAYELVYENIDGTLICDNMAAFLMQKGKVDAIVVGADRVAKNGDTANKIGTYSLAVLAKYHNVPFFVASPSTTLDLLTETGESIHIEERPGDEVCVFKGERVAAEGIKVWNPAFDVTPACLIEGIITEKACIYKDDRGEDFDIVAHVNDTSADDITAATLATLATSDDDNKNNRKKNKYNSNGEFYALDSSKVLDYVARFPKACAPIGGASARADWTANEVGDGNINFVYIITNKKMDKSIILKQGLPFVRCVGESWPLTQERVRYEAEALIAAHEFCPEHVPEVYLYDPNMSTIAMRFIEAPHKIARVGLCEGLTYENMGKHIGKYLAETLYKSSAICLGAEKFRANRNKFGQNEAMCALTEQVIFTEPYGYAQNNKWTSPELDDIVLLIQSDDELKIEITRLKTKFINQCEALLHGDLHTGSFMCSETSTFVIDHEFAFYGPMAFDLGAVLANINLAAFAAEGLGHGDRGKYFAQMHADVILTFSIKFNELWAEQGWREDYGGLSHPLMFDRDQESFQQVRGDFISSVLQDALRFAGAKMIRRIIGIAHVADMELIQDRAKRAECERMALEHGIILLKGQVSI